MEVTCGVCKLKVRYNTEGPRKGQIARHFYRGEMCQGSYGSYPVCQTCKRTHKPDSFCPRRVSRAILDGDLASLSALTDADKQYIQDYLSTGVKVSEFFEEAMLPRSKA